MASADILSQTLTSITGIKLNEIQNQRNLYEKGKTELLAQVAKEPTQIEKLRVLLDKIDGLAVMGKVNNNPLISLNNARAFLEQAERDPSVTDKQLNDWQVKLEKELDIHSLKYEYADLYGRLVTEWLAGNSADESSDISSDESSFETVGRKEMHEQRETWEGYVFKALETDVEAIQANLTKLFTSSNASKDAYKNLRNATKRFEKAMAFDKAHFDVDSLKNLIQGLLRSDLVTDEKTKVLRDFLGNKVVLAEIADVLNMRILSLEKWQWDPKGTWVEQRRMLNGRYSKLDHPEFICLQMLTPSRILS